MTTFYSYIRIILFLGCTLVGIQIPVFVDQYGNSLDSHLAESRRSLAQFQHDADRFFGGSLEKLIIHYKNTKDQVFNAGGDSIQSIYERNQLLEKHAKVFHRSVWSAYTQVVVAPVPDVKQEVWQNYNYVVQLRPESIIVGLSAGLVFTVTIELFLRMLVMLSARLIGSTKRGQPPA